MHIVFSSAEKVDQVRMDGVHDESESECLSEEEDEDEDSDVLVESDSEEEVPHVPIPSIPSAPTPAPPAPHHYGTRGKGAAIHDFACRVLYSSSDELIQ
jgi:hypothetical protein